MLLMWGVFTLLLWIVSFRLNKAVWSIFLLLWVTFFLLAWSDFGYSIGNLTCGTLGGYFGLLTGLDALFVAFVEVLNATAGRVVIALGDPIISLKSPATIKMPEEESSGTFILIQNERVICGP